MILSIECVENNRLCEHVNLLPRCEQERVAEMHRILPQGMSCPADWEAQPNPLDAHALSPLFLSLQADAAILFNPSMKRFTRISIRTLLVLITVLDVWLAFQVNRAHRQ